MHVFDRVSAPELPPEAHPTDPAWPATLAGRAAALAGVTVAYYLASRLGLEFKTEPEKLAAFWPPNGLLAGLLLAAGRGAWAPLAAAAAAAGLAANLAGGNGWAVSAGFAAVNTGEPLLLAWAWGRLWPGPCRLDTAAAVLRLFALVPVVCTATGAAGAALVVFGLGAADFPATWLAFGVADAVGILLVAPVVVTLAAVRRADLAAAPRARWAEGAVLAAAGLALAAVVLAAPAEFGGRQLAVRVLAVPLLAWAALRFGPAAAAGMVLLLSLVVVWNTAHGRGVFADPGTPAAERLLVVQFFLSVVALCALGLAAVTAERRAALAALRASQERVRLVTDTMDEVFWVLDPVAGRVEYVSPAFERVWGRPRAEVLAGGARPEWVHPDDRAALADALAAARAGGPAGRAWEVEYRVVHPGGAVRWVRTRAYPLRDPGGVVTRVVGITQDVTDRKAAERATQAALEELRQAAAEITTLRGFIPICAWCKKIRDDAGFWEQLEVYLRRHTAAEFSHGICPECYDRELKVGEPAPAG